MYPGLFSTRPLSENEARIRYNFDHPPKILGAASLMRAVPFFLIPSCIVYLMMFYGLSFLPSIISGGLSLMVLKSIGFHCVLPTLQYVFTSRAARHRDTTRLFLQIAMLFINYGEDSYFYAATTVIVSLVCVIGGYWPRDPSGFSEGAAEGFMILVLIEIFYKKGLNWPNIVCALLAALICCAALYTEIEKALVRVRDVLLRANLR